MFFTRDPKSNDCFNSKCIFYETFHQKYLVSEKGAMTRMINSTCIFFFFFLSNIESQRDHSSRSFSLRETHESYDSQNGFFFCITRVG